MYKQQKEKICVLHASDEHLITMLIPYIYKQIEEEKKVVTIFEKDFRKVSEKILKCIKEENEINIDWNKTNINDLNLKLNKSLDNSIIIVSGENKFIEKVDCLLNNINEKFIIINCFNIFKNEKRISEIIGEYEKILTTQGVEKIKNSITCII